MSSSDLSTPSTIPFMFSNAEQGPPRAFACPAAPTTKSERWAQPGLRAPFATDPDHCRNLRFPPPVDALPNDTLRMQLRQAGRMCCIAPSCSVRLAVIRYGDHLHQQPAFSRELLRS